jgi:hypothetical protein
MEPAIASSIFLFNNITIYFFYFLNNHNFVF